MQPFTVHQGLCATLERDDVDTDQIIPKQFLKRTNKHGYGDACFFDWRYDELGKPNPAFELNQPRYAGASILITGRNFGCGSSREHAAWALLGYGLRAVIAPSFADIFRTNALQNGLLPVTLSTAEVRLLTERARQDAGWQVEIDLSSQSVTDRLGRVATFEIEDFWRECLLEGLDPISMAERRDAEITAYEQGRSELLPTTSFLAAG
jgi:3-isopropylmalate/(R)-2-methylmalate dehydratase small subunit